jgi:adenosyl cobinamide kinase/adenosyl cobinamide phosphate guanylyltransferase
MDMMVYDSDINISELEVFIKTLNGIVLEHKEKGFQRLSFRYISAIGYPMVVVCCDLCDLFSLQSHRSSVVCIDCITDWSNKNKELRIDICDTLVHDVHYIGSQVLILTDELFKSKTTVVLLENELKVANASIASLEKDFIKSIHQVHKLESIVANMLKRIDLIESK